MMSVKSHKPQVEELVVAKVIEQGKDVFTLELLEYNQMKVQMLSSAVCNSIWPDEIKRACPLNRMVVCSVSDVSGLVPMVVMSTVKSELRDSTLRYWRQYRRALAYSQKATKKSGLPESLLHQLFVSTSSDDKMDIIADPISQGHRIEQMIYLDQFEAMCSKATSHQEIWNTLLKLHSKIFGVHQYTHKMRVGIMMNSPNGVDVLNTIMSGVSDLSSKSVQVVAWRNEPPFYDFEIKSIKKTDIPSVSKEIASLINRLVGDDGEVVFQEES